MGGASSCPQGVYARGIVGNASSSRAQMFQEVVGPLAEAGAFFMRSVKV